LIRYYSFLTWIFYFEILYLAKVQPVLYITWEVAFKTRVNDAFEDYLYAFSNNTLTSLSPCIFFDLCSLNWSVSIWEPIKIRFIFEAYLSNHQLFRKEFGILWFIIRICLYFIDHIKLPLWEDECFSIFSITYKKMLLYYPILLSEHMEYGI